MKDQLRSGGIKKKLPSTEKIEEITKKVYAHKQPRTTRKKQEKPKAKPKEQDSTHRTTIDMPKSIHILAKVEAMKEGISLKKFILNVMEAELKKRGQL